MLSMKPTKNPPTVSCTLIKNKVHCGIGFVSFGTALINFCVHFLASYGKMDTTFRYSSYMYKIKHSDN